MNLKIKKLHEKAIIPQYQTTGAACFDLHALIDDGRTRYIHDGGSSVFSTGLAFEIPEGYAMLIYSRSGHGFKFDTRLANCVGVIDSDYVGEIKVKLSCDNGQMHVNHGDRIAQAMIMPVKQVELIEVDEIKTTDRGDGGFGSTGR